MRDRALLASGSAKKLLRERLEPRLQRRIDAVADDVEEAALATRAADRVGDGAAIAAAADERADVDRRGICEKSPSIATQRLAFFSRSRRSASTSR